MNATPLRTGRRRRQAFTLVELLTVIAIIAILMAIVLPVFATVKENARRTACMSNMQQLYTGLRQYELDNRRYPDFLLGPAIKAAGGGCAVAETPAGSGQYYLQMAAPGETACTMQQASSTAVTPASGNPYSLSLGGEYAAPGGTMVSPFSGGLYPEYVRSLETFHCPNNSADLGGADMTNDAGTVAASRVAVGKDLATGATSGTNASPTPVSLAYYRYDTYDANPALNPDGTLNRTGMPSTPVYAVRYSRLWTRVRTGATGDPLPAATDPEFATYRNQLYWRAPSNDTFVTMCTYHAPKGKVTALWLSGSAKVIDTNKLKSYNSTNGAVPAGKPDLKGTNGRDFDLYKLGPSD
jgi:prepilin-type N-terminal cleavage/methylation domain-containing protein